MPNGTNDPESHTHEKSYPHIHRHIQKLMGEIQREIPAADVRRRGLRGARPVRGGRLSALVARETVA